VDTFKCAPELRCLDLGFWSSWFTIKIPWAQLTEYYAKDSVLNESLNRLAQMPHLIKCRLDARFSGSMPSCFHVHLIHLQVLTLDSNVATADFLDHLSLPALRAFSYVESSLGWWPNARFVALLSRSLCQLHTLRLFVELTEADLIDCLRCTPSLIKLRLWKQGPRCITIATLNRLTNPGPECGCLVPKLRVFGFDYYSTLDGSTFADMVQSRRRSSLDSTHFPMVQLESVPIRFVEEESAIDPEPLARLRQFRDEGLVIYKWGGRRIVEL
jgi:hypothetical protein